jgi:tetratricopeptide (TPR) repeat protein
MSRPPEAPLSGEARTGGEPMASVDAVLARAFGILNSQPASALQTGLGILKAAPNHLMATLLVGSAHRLLGQTATALTLLGSLACSQPRAAAVQFEYGLALLAAGRNRDAIASMRRAAELNPTLPGVWRSVADQLRAIGDAPGADAAYMLHVKAGTRDPRLLRPAAALRKNDLIEAEALLGAHVRDYPTDVAALRMLAETVARMGRYPEAETLLVRCLELAPSFAEARAHYATVLERCNRPVDALQQIDRLLAAEPRHPHYRSLKSAALVGIGEYQQAYDLCAELLAEYPAHDRTWLNYGIVLKTTGRYDEAIRAYRKSLELAPRQGEAWWSLANLKTFRFSPADIVAMQRGLEHAQSTDDDRLHLHFALGKAFEDATQYELSFRHYAEGNRLARQLRRYSAQHHARFAARTKAMYTGEFLRQRAAAGCPAPDPIFIVGLPRAGSTLVEQILASHSMVEATMELVDIMSLAHGLGRFDDSTTKDALALYPEVLATLAPERFRQLGEEYLARTRVHRKTAAPFFIDKLPNNFLHLGLIILALPNAKIIDVRRHPLGCCFSVFKQHFSRGQAFSYSLEDIGRFYRHYVELMAHFDQLLPGRIYRVHYEALVENTETEIRALLDHCQLPFEENCLRFYENRRAVQTASSEQVRRPIFREGLEQWRHYEPWLDPLKAALGPVLEAYPAVRSRQQDREAAQTGSAAVAQAR